MSEDSLGPQPLPGVPSRIREAWQEVLKGLSGIPGAEDAGRELADYLVQLQGMIAAQMKDIDRSNEIVDECLRFEDLASDFSRTFMTLTLEEMREAISRALGDACRLFAADGCALFEVEGSRIGLEVDSGNHVLPPPLIVDLICQSRWAYRHLVEQGGSIVQLAERAEPQETPGQGLDQEWGVKCLIILPLYTGERVTHLIGLWNRDGERQFSATFVKRLHFLGSIFVCALNHLLNGEALLKEQGRLEEAQRLAHLGSWDWDLASDTLRLSPEAYRIFGLPREESSTTPRALLLSVFPPDDQRMVDEAIERAMAGTDGEFAMEHRIVRPDGSTRVVRASGELIRDNAGKPVRMIGTVLDITDSKRAEEALQSALREIEEHKEQLEAENIYLRQEIKTGEGLPNIIGSSDAIARVLRKLRQVAQTRTTVLLTGETGTGKGVFARALHAISTRSGKPFVQVNCAGLPPNLIESELFGREKGAFTGSTMRQIGRFELADGGTIFLDEIGELPLELQAKLLKVVEEGEFERLGSPHPVRVDVRIIASTNRNLKEEIARGNFRSDLFYRLSVFPIEIPPLRDRKSDIPLLVEFYVDRFSKSYGKKIVRIPKELMRGLERQTWPGNVRELINTVERAVIVSHGAELRMSDGGKPATAPLPARQHSKRVIPEAPATTPTGKGLADVEREHILRTLEGVGWRIEGPSGAAQRLDMKPSTLRAKMKKLGIERPGHSPNKPAP